jgi:hypothetical protein
MSPLPTSDYVTLQDAAAATGNGTTLVVADRATVTLQVVGTFAGTVTFEGTIDGTNWISLQAYSKATATISTVTASTQGLFTIPVSGLRFFRARISAYTSGSITVYAVATTAPQHSQYALTVQPADTPSGAVQTQLVNAWMSAFGPTYWERWRNNQDVTLLASAARTATVSSPDQVNYNGRGVVVTLNVSALADTPSIVLTIEAKMGALYEVLLTAAAVTATGTHSFIVYPGVGAASGDVVQVAGFPLPRTWRVTLTHADADSITYSVTASVLL